MAGLDLGTLAGYHRHDLAREMRKSRIANIGKVQSVRMRNDAGRPNLPTRSGLTAELWVIRLRRRQALQKVN